MRQILTAPTRNASTWVFAYMFFLSTLHTEADGSLPLAWLRREENTSWSPGRKDSGMCAEGRVQITTVSNVISKQVPTARLPLIFGFP